MAPFERDFGAVGVSIPATASVARVWSVPYYDLEELWAKMKTG